MYGLKQSRRQHWISFRTLCLGPEPEPDTHRHRLCLHLNCSIYNLYSVLERCAGAPSTCANTKWISHQKTRTHARWIILRNSVPRFFHVRKFEFAVCAVLRIHCISLSWNLHDKCVIRLVFDVVHCSRSRSLRTAVLSQHIQSSSEMHAQLPPQFWMRLSFAAIATSFSSWVGLHSPSFGNSFCKNLNYTSRCWLAVFQVDYSLK